MARYVTTVTSSMSAGDAFNYMADLRNFARWDPGVKSVRQVSGDGGGAHASFDVVVDGSPRPMTLRYATTTYDPPRLVVVEARNRWLTSVDRITVSGSITATVTYDAALTLNGPLALFDPLLGRVFRRIGDRAAAGLRRALTETGA